MAQNNNNGDRRQKHSRVGDIIDHRGAFVQALVDYLQEPTPANLLAAYRVAAPENRRALCDSCRPVDGELSGDGDDAGRPLKLLRLIVDKFSRWRPTRQSLAAQFEVIRQLDERMRDPFNVPIRKDC